MSLRLRLFYLAAATVALTLQTQPVWAVWPVDPTVNLPVAVAPGRQTGRLDLVTDGAGGAVIAWSDQRSGDWDVYAHHIMPDGFLDPIWPADGFRMLLPTDQISPRLFPDGAGGTIIFWLQFLTVNNAILAQHVDASGIADPAWPSTGLGLTVGMAPSEPGFAQAGGGNVLVAWEEDAGPNGGDIYVQSVTSGGLAWGGGPVIACGTAGDQRNPAIAFDMTTGVIVAWEDARTSASDLDLYAQRVTTAGLRDPLWPFGGIPVCTVAGSQLDPAAVTDGVGGVFVAWRDFRSGADDDLYIQHVLANGTLDPAWPATGRLVLSGLSWSEQPLLVVDGFGGALVLQRDTVWVVNHVLANGTLDPTWPAGGCRLMGLLAAEADMIPDGTGGAILVFDKYEASSTNIYAFHVLANGALDPGWPAGGRAVCTAPQPQTLPVAVTDGSGGAILAWVDGRDFFVNEYDIYAQRVRASGVLGIPEPHIVSALDVPGDQGGRLLLAWDPSEGDALPNPYVDNYHVWRMVDEVVAQRAGVRDARLATGSSTGLGATRRAPPRPGEVRQRGTGVSATWWEFIATVPASQLNGYAYMVATTADSMPGSVPWNVFVVDAEDLDLWSFYSSPPDSGYSVDNLAPGAPAPFTGAYEAGATHLHWNPNPEADVAGYRLYRGAFEDFTPGPGNLIAAPSDTGYADPGPAGNYYKLSAVDVHVNEGPHALLTPESTVDVEPAEPLVFALDPVRPNPARGDRLMVSFVIPIAQAARLELLDVTGRRVAARDVGALGVGRHELDLSQGRRLAPGLYVVRLSQGRAVRTEKVAVFD